MRTAKLILHSMVAAAVVFYTLATALLAVPLTANAQTAGTDGVPGSIGYNGRLFNSSGTALSGTYYFWVNLKDHITTDGIADSPIQAFADADGSGAANGTETAITVTNGYFTVEVPLGASVANFNENLWLELLVHSANVVGSAETLSPRVKVTKTPYAIVSQAIERLSADPTGFEGRMYYDTDEDKLKYYNSTTAAWDTLEGYMNVATLTLDNSAATAVNIGTGAVAKTVTLGNVTTTTGLVLNAGTGDIALSSQDDINIGTNAVAQDITVGNTTGTSSVQVNTGSGGFGVNAAEFDITAGTGAIVIDDSGNAGSITVEGSVLDINSLDFVGTAALTSAAGADFNVTAGTTGAVTIDSGSTGLVNLGTGAAAKTITIGNAVSTESEINALLVDINGGTGGVTIDGGAASNFTTSVGALVLSTTAGGTSSSLILRSVDTSDDAIYLDADGALGSGITLDAYDATTNTTGAILLNSAYVQIDTSNSNGLNSAGLDVNVGDSGTISMTTTSGAVSLTAGGGSNVTLTSASGGVSFDTQTADQTIRLGTSDVDRNINIGTTTGADTITLGDATGADTFNFLSGVSTSGDVVDVTFASLTTGDAFDIDTAALTTGDVFDITPGAVRTGGSALHITDTSLAAAVTGDLMQIDVTGTKDTNTLDIDVSGSTLATGNEIDITYSGAVHSGNAIDLNMGTNVAGDAVNIASAATSGNVIQIVTDGAFTDSIVDIDANSGDWQGNMFEVTTGGSASDGDVFNVALEALDVAVQNMVVTNAAATTANGWMLDLDTTAAWTGIAMDVDFGTAASTGNFLDVTYADAAHTGDTIAIATGTNLEGNAMQVTTAGIRTAPVFFVDGVGTDGGTDDHIIDINQSGLLNSNVLDITYSSGASDGNAIDLNMGTNVAGNALAIATAGTTAGRAIEIISTGTINDSLVDVDMASGDWQGNILEITTGGSASDGDVFNINLEPLDVAVQNMVVSNAAASSTAGWLLDLDTNAAWSGDAIDVRLTTAVSTGDFFVVTYADAAHTGDAFQVDMGTNLEGNAMQVTTAGIRTAPVFFVDGVGTDGGTDDHIIDINQSGLLNSNVLDITYSSGASDGNAIDLNMGTNVAGDAMNIVTAATTGQAIEIGSTGDFQNNLVDITTTAAWDGNVLGFDDTGNVIWTGNVIDLTTGTGNATGNLVDLAIEASANGDVQAIVLNASGPLDQAGWAMEVNAGGVFTASAFDFDITAVSAIASGDIFSFDSSGNAAFTSNIIDIDTGTGAGASNLIDLNIEAIAAGDVQAIVLNASGPLDQAGWAMEVNAGGVFTASAFDFDITAVSAIASGDIFSFDSSGNAAFTSNIIDIDTGTGVATGNLVDLTIEAGSTAATAIAVSNAAVTAMGTDVGWLIAATGSAAFTSNMIDLNTTSTSSGNILDVTYSTAAATGNALDLNMGTNVAGNALDIATSATTGNAIDITTAGIFANELIDINLGAQASTGEVINIAMGSTGLLTQAIAVSNGAASASGVDVGWLIAATGSGVFTSNMIDLNSSSTGSGNIVDVTYGASAATGNALDLNMVGNVAGDALNIASAATTGQAIEIGSTGDFQNNLVDITTTAAWDGNVLGFDDTGNVIWTGNVIDLTTGTGNATGNLVDLAIEASANGDV
ncbi:MAG: hypothetical protein AAB413_01990, partial [Patescibacteria group bacterium]